jgi:pimeloyl-ACP methyl ester carboxylesterase
MFVERDGARIFCEVEGSGEPAILFVHGGGIDHRTWTEHVAHFAPKFRVATMDLRGHGQSDQAESYSSDLFKDDVVAVINALQLAPAVIVGASRGGGIAIRVAVDYPELVKAVVSIDYVAATRDSAAAPWAYTPEKTAGLLADLASDWYTNGARRLVDSWFPEEGVPEELRERLAQYCRENKPEVVHAVRTMDVRETDREDYLRRLRKPTLVLQSSTGIHLGREQGQYIHDRVPGSQLHYFEGRGHGCFMSAPEEFWEEVERFLAGLPKE